MSAEFSLMLTTLRAVDNALETPREMPADENPWPEKCNTCDYLQTVYDYPMGDYEGFGSVCCGERCTREGECDRV